MVDILMATYNGERYITAQIYSLLYQSCRDIRIIIHDDGSSDKTVDIVNEISKTDKRIMLINDGIKCGSAGKNFIHLLRYSSAKFIMFCDQDDIWLDNKVDLMLNEIKKYSQECPLVIYSNSYIWLANKGIEGVLQQNGTKALRDYLFLNCGVQGCASIFNEKMRDELLKWTGNISMHDHLLQMIGVTFGNIYYMESSLMLYRRHSASVTASMSIKASIRERLIKNKTLPVVSIIHLNTIKKFLTIYLPLLSSQDRVLIREYISMTQMNTAKRILTVLRNRFRIYNSVVVLIVKILLRPYLGKI